MAIIRYYLILLFLVSKCLLFSQSKIKFLENNLFKITSIENNDFSFLDSVLMDKNVVFLGGGQHSVMNDGLTRLKLVKYLHEKKGFNIILMERSFYNLYTLNNSIDNSMNIENQLSKYLDINLDDYEFELIKMIRESQKKGEDFLLGGLDIYLSYNQGSGFRNPFKVLDDNNSLLKDSKEILYLKREIDNFSADKQIMKKTLDYLYNNALLNNFFSNDSLNELWFQICKNILVDYYYRNNRLNGKPETGFYYAYRDSIMADNFNYYKKLYKGKKIIVFTSTYHITKGNNDFSYLSGKIFGKNIKTMGQYISNDTANKIYSVITIFNKGCVATNIKLRNGTNIFPKRNKNSVEFELKQQGYNNVFIDLRKLSDNKKFIMYPFYTEPLSDSWGSIYDGLIYIEEAFPSKKLEFFEPVER